MRKQNADQSAVYQGISGTCKITGLSQFFLRNLARSGKCPAVIKSGRTYYFRVDQLLDWLKGDAHG